jgi:hypothetical protein
MITCMGMQTLNSGYVPVSSLDMKRGEEVEEEREIWFKKSLWQLIFLTDGWMCEEEVGDGDDVLF